MESWLQDRLSKLLKFQVPDDLINYISSIDNNRDLEDYLRTLLDFDDPKHRLFVSDLVQKRNNPALSSAGTSGKQSKKKIAKGGNEQELQDIDGTGNKKRTKYVNLYSKDGKNVEVVLLKGRHHCDCQASKHGLINNCLKCGRIICQQEGSGPCLFCGTIVVSPEEEKVFKENPNSIQVQELMNKKRPQGWEAALSQRNRLLEYDRTSERRTKVTDDDSDYFNTGSTWLSKTEREKLDKYQKSIQDKKHASRLSKKMTFDFAGRRVVEDDTIDYAVDENFIKAITNTVSLKGKPGNNMMSTCNSAPGDMETLLQYDPSVEYGDINDKPAKKDNWKSGQIYKVQDAGLLEMVDAAKCLSMHQPWASLLVEGIKIHEGRGWYSSHRGRLWIAATAKQPDEEVIRSVEHASSVFHNDESLEFPASYPVGCLLGCVSVDDCLPQDEYRRQFPDGESDSPYVFICSNPIQLPLKFPIKGQHKLYKLDKNIHQAAVKCIERMQKLQAEKAK